MRSALTGLAVLVALSGVAAAQDNKQDIKLGFLGTFTGPLSSAGNDMRDAAELALDRLGRKMGGRPVTVVYEDEDIYRGVDRRDVILMHPDDVERFGLREGGRVTVRGPAGEMKGIGVVIFEAIIRWQKRRWPSSSKSPFGLNAVIPMHTHFDHAMDSAIVARRSSYFPFCGPASRVRLRR